MGFLWVEFFYVFLYYINWSVVEFYVENKKKDEFFEEKDCYIEELVKFFEKEC